MQTKQEKTPPPFNVKWLAEKFNFNESDVISAQWVTFDIMFQIIFKPEATSVAESFSKKLGAINCSSNWYHFNNSVEINERHKERLLQFQLKPETNIDQKEIDSLFQKQVDSLLNSNTIQVNSRILDPINSSTFAPILLPGKKIKPPHEALDGGLAQLEQWITEFAKVVLCASNLHQKEEKNKETRSLAARDSLFYNVLSDEDTSTMHNYLRCFTKDIISMMNNGFEKHPDWERIYTKLSFEESMINKFACFIHDIHHKLNSKPYEGLTDISVYGTAITVLTQSCGMNQANPYIQNTVTNKLDKRVELSNQ